MITRENLKIPSQLVQNIIALYGDAGSKWLKDFPQFIFNYENQWQFKAGKCFSDAQFNVVLNATKYDGEQVVFKCCIPNKEFKTEVKALEHYNGDGAVKVLQYDIENGAMLIEKINPGILLEKCALSIEAATIQAVAVCQKLHRPIKNILDFPTLTDWFEGFSQRLFKKFDGTSGPFSKEWVEKVDCLSRELLASQTNLVLLHGDLHYANLLLAENNEFNSIDPKGVIGEPEFEIPLPRVTNSVSKSELLYRLDCYIEQSQFDKKRIYAWLFSKAILAAWWTVEDSGSPNELTQRFLSVAEIMQ